MDRHQKKRFQRWQQKTIDQFTNLINILLTLSSLFLGFLISFKFNSEIHVSKWVTNILIVITTILVVILVYLSYNRLMDFRLTKNKIRDKDISDDEIRDIGNNSWCLLKISLLLFSADILFFVIVMLMN